MLYSLRGMENQEKPETRGSRLRTLRKRCGLTLDNLGRQIKVAPASLSLLERGKRTPSRDLLSRLSKFFEVSMEFIETGELSHDDQARIDRARLWPEIVYFVGNHIIVPRRLEPEDVLPAHDDLRRAVRQAWDSPHLRDYRAWARSATGRRIGDNLHAAPLDEFLESLFGKNAIGQAGEWNGLHERVNRQIDHFLWARPRKSSPETRHPAAGFAFDLEAIPFLYEKLPLILLGVPASFTRDAYRDEFVNAAFPAIFWSAARLWGDRRLAGWLWYLNMPLKLYAPLARIARQYDNPEAFKRSADILLDKTDPEDKDVFLGLFPDILGCQDIYGRSFGTVATFLGALSVHPIHRAFGDVGIRRGIRRKRLSHDLIDLIESEGGPSKLEAAEQALKKIAPPFVDSPVGMLAPRRKPVRRRPPAREKDRPPEALP